ncbi:hypothetical protein [Streptomyces noursei]
MISIERKWSSVLLGGIASRAVWVIVGGSRTSAVIVVWTFFFVSQVIA